MPLQTLYRAVFLLVLHIHRIHAYWHCFLEWWPRSQKEIGGGTPTGITQVGSSHRPRQHRLLQIGRFQHCPREEETQLRNFRHVIGDNEVRNTPNI